MPKEYAIANRIVGAQGARSSSAVGLQPRKSKTEFGFGDVRTTSNCGAHVLLWPYRFVITSQH
jgi:hypothetical protein